MSESISLREAERATFRTTFEDGLIDVFLGCVTLMFVIAPFLPLGDFWNSFVFVPFWVCIYLVIRWLRKHVVKPRIGVVRLGTFRKVRLRKFSLIAFGVCTIALILGIVSAANLDWPGWVHMSGFGLAILIGFGIAGYFLDFPRLYLYGILLVFSLPVGEWLYSNLGAPHHGYPISFGVTAAVMFVWGFLKFFHLVRRHPIPAADQAMAEE